MNKHKNHQTKKHRWLGNHRLAFHRNRTAIAYTLEPLESRILLSADLASAVEFNPETLMEAPSQAVVLNISDSPGAAVGQQTFTVAELLPTSELFGPQMLASDNGTVAQPPVSSPPNMATVFGRLFPTLPAFSADTPAVREALLELGKEGGLMDAGDDPSDPKTLITDPNKSLNNPDNPAMTAGMTFLGQFLDHDLTFDRTSSLERQQNPASVPNARTPAFELDSLYGAGPQGSPQLYDQSAAGRGIKFLIEEIPDSPSQSRGGAVRYDVPRDSQGPGIDRRSTQ